MSPSVSRALSTVTDAPRLKKTPFFLSLTCQKKTYDETYDNF